MVQCLLEINTQDWSIGVSLALLGFECILNGEVSGNSLWYLKLRWINLADLVYNTKLCSPAAHTHLDFLSGSIGHAVYVLDFWFNITK